MGYELHITRAASWLDAESAPLPSDIWYQIVATDRSLAVSSSEYFERKDDRHGTVRIPGVVWAEDDDVVFWFDQGEVTVKRPSDAAIIKMIELASKMGARVFGDDDEEYVSSPEPPGYVVLRDAPEAVGAVRPWWKFW